MVNIQHWLNQIITEKIATEEGATVPVFQYGLYAMPAAGYLSDDFYSTLSGMLPFMMILAFIYPYFVLSGAIVTEKASKIKEGLQMMGASITTYWLSVYIYYGTKFFIISFLCTAIAFLTHVFEYSNFLLILIYFTLFLWTLLTSAIMLSTFFDNPKTASMVSSVFLLTLYFLNAAGDSMSRSSQKTGLCLSGPACFAMGSNNLGKYEEGLIGIKWDNVDEEYQLLSFETVLVMMFVDCIIYTILALSFISFYDYISTTAYTECIWIEWFLHSMANGCPRILSLIQVFGARIRREILLEMIQTMQVLIVVQ